MTDLRYALRTLRRSPAFTATAAGVLALGIGVSGAMFSLFDAALVRALPFPDPDRLVMVWERSPRFAHNRVSPLNFLDWSEQQRSFAAFAAVAGGGRTLTSPGRTAEYIPGQAVTSRFFDVLGVRSIAGRTFDAADVGAGAKVVVLSERLWRRRFGADPDLVGRTLVLDGDPLTVIGIVPAPFQILFRADLWTLFVPRRSPEQRKQHYLQVIGRLADDATIESATTEMGGIAARIAVLSPDTNKDWGVTLEPLRTAIVGTELRTTTLVMAGAVGFVLLLACANVANLLLARGLSRTRELAIRAAIGASRRRIVGQLLIESAVIASIGGAAGLALTGILLRAAPSLLPVGTLPQSIALTFDARVMAAALLLSTATAVLVGFVPAWQTSDVALAHATASGGRGATRTGQRVRAAIVVGEIAIATVLLAGAGLLTRTLVAMTRFDHGFVAERVITGSIVLPFKAYATADRLQAFYRSAERELSSIPGVTVAALGGSLPLDGWDIGQGFEVVGDQAVEGSQMRAAHYQIVSPGYFRALGIALLSGRPFDQHDTSASAQVCIVNEEFARRHLAGRDPLSTSLSVQSMDLRGGPTPVVRRIVGVIRQVSETAGERERAVEVYVPIAQNPWFSASIVLRTAGDPTASTAAISEAIARVDPDLPVTRIRTMEQVAADSTAQPRFRAQLIGGFSVLAATLAAVGLFGVVAYSVGQRAREFGIRVALGAAVDDVLRLVLVGVLKMMAAGLAIGLAAAAILSRFMTSLLFETAPRDPRAFGGAVAVLVVAALAACALPAWRATRVDPAAALRDE